MHINMQLLYLEEFQGVPTVPDCPGQSRKKVLCPESQMKATLSRILTFVTIKQISKQLTSFLL